MRRVAAALVDAARAELELTPKPGLVDRRDNGSHPDLSFELMSRSIDLLPIYFEELLEIAGGRAGIPLEADPTHAADSAHEAAITTLDACIAAGRRAEERMLAAIGTNAHRGYIFLAGLVLLAAASGARTPVKMRQAIARLAGEILADGRRGPDGTHGARVRRQLGVEGIHGEALAGLPAVFDHGLPALRRAVAAFGDTDRARHYLMSVLMTRLEDTTALHRCGREGLERLRRDGSRLQAAIERGEEYVQLLVALNEEYRAVRLTMGGVADCMAVTMAVNASGQLAADS